MVFRLDRLAFESLDSDGPIAEAIEDEKEVSDVSDVIDDSGDNLEDTNPKEEADGPTVELESLVDKVLSEEAWHHVNYAIESIDRIALLAKEPPSNARTIACEAIAVSNGYSARQVYSPESIFGTILDGIKQFFQWVYKKFKEVIKWVATKLGFMSKDVEKKITDAEDLAKKVDTQLDEKVDKAISEAVEEIVEEVEKEVKPKEEPANPPDGVLGRAVPKAEIAEKIAEKLSKVDVMGVLGVRGVIERYKTNKEIAKDAELFDLRAFVTEYARLRLNLFNGKTGRVFQAYAASPLSNIDENLAKQFETYLDKLRGNVDNLTSVSANLKKSGAFVAGSSNAMSSDKIEKEIIEAATNKNDKIDFTEIKLPQGFTSVSKRTHGTLKVEKWAFYSLSRDARVAFDIVTGSHKLSLADGDSNLNDALSLQEEEKVSPNVEFKDASSVIKNMFGVTEENFTNVRRLRKLLEVAGQIKDSVTTKNKFFSSIKNINSSIDALEKAFNKYTDSSKSLGQIDSDKSALAGMIKRFASATAKMIQKCVKPVVTLVGVIVADTSYVMNALGDLVDNVARIANRYEEMSKRAKKAGVKLSDLEPIELPVDENGGYAIK